MRIEKFFECGWVVERMCFGDGVVEGREGEAIPSLRKRDGREAGEVVRSRGGVEDVEVLALRGPCATRELGPQL